MRIAILMLALLTVSGAAAKPLAPGCFARTYDAAHLAAHPDQRVRRIVLRVEPAASDGRVPFGLELSTRNRRPVWHAGGTCEPAGAAWSCRPDTDGAPMLGLVAEGTGMRLDNSRYLSIFDMVTGPGLQRVDIRAPGDAVFRLAKASARTCATD